jgi:hypothetical protein
LAAALAVTGDKPVVKARKVKNQELATQVKEALKVARWQSAVDYPSSVLSPSTK